jgi:hypothetical protein
VLLLGVLPGSLVALALGLMAFDLGVQGSFVANQARIDAIDPDVKPNSKKASPDSILDIRCC